MIRPTHITFTGADDSIKLGDFPELHELAREYPIEWGVLFSASRSGSPRYPSPLWATAFMEFAQRKGLALAAHICGAHAREVLARGTMTSLNAVFAEGVFRRAQINIPEAVSVDRIRNLRDWAEYADVEVILQCRGDFPQGTGVQWLYDASGGRGITPKAWPVPALTWCGYAGGLSPENVAGAVEAISATHPVTYWIDMETGVRDDADRFSLEKCRAVCEAVYGKAGGAAC